MFCYPFNFITPSLAQWLVNLSSASCQQQIQSVVHQSWHMKWGEAECVTCWGLSDCRMWDCDGCCADWWWRRPNVRLLMTVGSFTRQTTCLPPRWLVISPPTKARWEMCLGEYSESYLQYSIYCSLTALYCQWLDSKWVDCHPLQHTVCLWFGEKGFPQFALLVHHSFWICMHIIPPCHWMCIYLSIVQPPFSRGFILLSP